MLENGIRRSERSRVLVLRTISGVTGLGYEITSKGVVTSSCRRIRGGRGYLTVQYW